MEELEQKQMHETKVSNFLNCSQISCLREPETQASMDTFFTRKSTQKRVRKSSPKEFFFFLCLLLLRPEGSELKRFYTY